MIQQPLDDKIIESWSEKELIQHVFFELRRSSASAEGLIQVINEGSLGFFNDEQERLLKALQRDIEIISEATHWMDIWKSSKKKYQSEETSTS